MDALGDWANFFSHQARTLASQPSAAASIGLQAYSTFQSLLFSAYGAVNSITAAFLTFQNGRPSINMGGTQSVDLVSVAFLLLILFLSLKILDMLRRVIWSWVVFFFKLAIWTGIALGGLYVWSRGAEGVWQDIQGGLDVYKAHRAFWENYVEDINRARREAIVRA